jgi:N6-L-threonylcarbamoyladenine synthase
MSPMITLAIESSCDETAVAILEGPKKVLVSLVSSQVALHAPFGGVIPEIASREHLLSISPLYQEALGTTGLCPKDIDLFAVTQGPGLIGALLIGVAFTKALAWSLKKPLQPVNHVHGHIHGALLGLTEPMTYPALALVVSGGHTNLYRMDSPTHFQLLGSTLDDACGECFDKVAKLLGLSYPGGAQIEALAAQGDPRQIPMPQIKTSGLDFSYSGLKTAVYYRLKKDPQTPKEDLCASFQEEAFLQLLRKTKQALSLAPYRSLIVAGGVSANRRFRDIFQNALGIPVLFPDPAYCSDNAAMIGALGYALYQESPEQKPWDAYSRYHLSQEKKP